MTVSLRHISGFVVFLWVAAISYEALMAPPPSYVVGMLVEAERSRTLLLFVGAALASCSVIIIIKRLAFTAGIVKRSTPTFLVFSLSLLLVMLSVLQNNTSAVAYAILLWFTLILTLYINQCLSDNFYLAVSVALVCSLVAFTLYHGFPNGRWIGGIHPNHIGAFAFSSVYFAARSRNRNRWLLYGIGIFFAILVSARYAIVAILVIGLFDYLTQIKLSLSRLFLATLLALIGLIVTVTGSDYILNDILRLDDPTRGLGSGMTGRVDSAGNFWGQFVQNPFIGHGFRSRDDYIATHNGFLNFTLENGIFATAILAALVFVGIYQFIRNYLTSGDTRQLMRIGLWSGWIIAGFFQPQIINFGDAFALTTMFLLTDNGQDTRA